MIGILGKKGEWRLFNKLCLLIFQNKCLEIMCMKKEELPKRSHLRMISIKINGGLKVPYPSKIDIFFLSKKKGLIN